MTRFRFRERVVDVDIDPTRIARAHSKFDGIRQALIGEHGDVRLVDEYLTQRLGAAFGKFGHDYLADMSARVDRIFQIRDELAGGVDAALRGETVHIDVLQKRFNDLSHELDTLASPKRAVETATKLEAPAELPPSARPPEPPPEAPPSRRRGRGGDGPPPDHLSRLARTPAAREGLRIVEDQIAAPELKAELTAVAQGHGESAARALLTQIARYLTPENVEELKGLNHFLRVARERSESPEPLQRLLRGREPSLGPGEAGPSDLAPDVRVALRAFRDCTPEAVHGLAVMFSGKHTAATGLRVFHNSQSAPGIINGILESLTALEKHAGLDRVISFLAAEGNPENFKAVQGQLRSAIELLERYPDAKVIFEERQGGRIVDIVLRRKHELDLHVEVKFLTTFDSFSRDIRWELARDLAHDAEWRYLRRRFEGIVEPPFQTVLWRFERGNLMTDLARRRGQAVTPADLTKAIKDNLRAVFRENEAFLRQELGPEFDAYLKAFEDSPFVETY
ncbi:MAG TPA: hypothetical protein VKB50_20550 [Vicinamibacterales bacterium]|nr:hypothetical protein [Vicinamibacterales bacterium]